MAPSAVFGTFRNGFSLDSTAPRVWRRLWQLRSRASEWTGVACGVIHLLTAAACPGLRQFGPSSAAGSAGCAFPLSARSLPMIARCRAAKALEGALAEIKMDQFPRCPTRAVCGAYIALQVCSC